MMTSTQSEAGSVAPGFEHDEGVIGSTAFHNHEKRKKTCAIAGFAILLVAAIVVIPTSVVLGKKEKSNSSSNASIGGSNSGNSNEHDGNADGDVSPYLQAVMHYFKQEGVTSEETFETIDSPQRRAAQWLAETDTYFDHSFIPETNITSTEGYNFMARYVMAVDFFALGGGNWNPTLNFLSSEDVCFWNNGEDLGVYCDVYDDSPIPRWIQFST